MDQMLAKYQPTALSLFRFITGLLLFQYGVAKIFKFPVLPYFANVPPLIYTAGAIELVGGALLMLGAIHRLTATGRIGARFEREDAPSAGLPSTVKIQVHPCKLHDQSKSSAPPPCGYGTEVGGPRW